MLRPLHALIAIAFAFTATPVLAADDAPASNPTPVTCTAPKVPNADKSACIDCAKGTKYDAEKKVCVTVNASLMNDRALYEQGRSLALAGYYQDALDTFAAIKNQNDAMTLTMIGYSKRKLGHTDEGIAIYHQALALDPNNVNTHEYLGEGYLAAGRIDLAELELDTLARLCGQTCEQYRDLKDALIGTGTWQ
ncbi:MAG TPA: tetratricopeptide repeat protein [Bauldia sp.]|nr:tetratricopeptide repeat protein [Bauldia sp.]